MLPWLAGIKHLIIIGAILGSHDLKLGERSSYLTMFSCPFGRYRYLSLLFRTVPVEDMLQKKADEILIGMPHVFGIADHILITVFDEKGKDHNETLDKVLWV